MFYVKKLGKQIYLQLDLEHVFDRGNLSYDTLQVLQTDFQKIMKTGSFVPHICRQIASP